MRHPEPVASDAMRICMLVYNNCTTDARVFKEAGTLRDAGHVVQIVAVLDAKTTREEQREGLLIRRIDRRPLHYRLLWWYRGRRRDVRLRRARWKRKLRSVVRRRLLLLRRRLLLTRRRGSRLLRAGRRWLLLARRRGNRLLLRLRLRLSLARRLGTRLLRASWRRLVRALPSPVRAVLRRTPTWRAPVLAPWRPAWPGRLRARRESRRLGAQRELRHLPVRRRRLRTPSASTRRLTWSATASSARYLVAPLWLIAWVWSRGFRLVSHVNYSLLMRCHKPLMFGDWYWRTYRLLRNERMDVVHAHDLITLPVAVALARRTGARLVYDAHELYPEVSTLSKTERRVWRTLERPLIRRADDVITVCESIGAELQARYSISAPTILLNCPPRVMGDDLPRDLLRTHAGVRNSEPLVLYQGGFAPNRGLTQLVRAAAHLERGHLVLMGWGKLEADLRLLVRDEGLAERVTIIGPVAQEVLLAYTVGADVGVIPYEPIGLNNTYTTPNKLFEYLAAGVPIVGSHLPELARVVLGREVGLTFARVEPELIAAALNHLLGDDELLARMRRNALAARDHYTWERQAEHLLGLYAGVNGSSPALTQAA